MRINVLLNLCYKIYKLGGLVIQRFDYFISHNVYITCFLQSERKKLDVDPNDRKFNALGYSYGKYATKSILNNIPDNKST